MKTKQLIVIFLVRSALSVLTLVAAPVSTSFTYQGKLSDGGQSATGIYDLRFTIYDAGSAGAAQSAPIALDDVGVTSGLFTVHLDFGKDTWSEGARWLEIGVRSGDSTNGFTLLSPRQPITAAPLAHYALTAGTANSALTAQMAASATTANSANSVSWQNVSAKPAGFADGIDNDTTYATGAGLNLSNSNQFSVNFGGSGTNTTVAHSDHSHFGATWNGSNSVHGLKVINRSATGRGITSQEGGGSGYAPIGGLRAGVWGDAEHGHGVIGSTASPQSAGVAAVGSGANGTALRIASGAIRVAGAGLNTATPVFIHQVTDQNRDTYCFLGLCSAWSEINNPYANNDPAAILIVTPRNNSPEVSVIYDSDKGRWQIDGPGQDATKPWTGPLLQVGASYNVMVIKP